MYEYDYLIVGAGLFGATAARQLLDRGKRCLVVDKRPHIAGNAYTEEIEGIQVHRYGAHIFHTSNREVWDFLHRFAVFLPFTHTPVADFHGKRYALPFNMHTFRQMWGVTTADEAKTVIERQRAAAGVTVPRNLEEQAISLVGRDIYETLVRGYTEKQWGRPCTALPPEIITRLPVRFTYDNNYFSDPYQGIPEGGYTAMVARMLEGADLRLSTDYLQHKEELDKLAPRVIWSGPIDAYFGYVLGPLAYRSLRFETEVLDMPDYQGTAVVNYTDRETPWTRVIEHKYFEPRGQKKTVVTREYPAAWRPGDEPYYPVRDAENTALYERYRRLAEREPRVVFGGRLGAYRYDDMDKTVAAALEAVKAVP